MCGRVYNVSVRCVVEFTRSVWDVWESLQGQCQMCGRVYMVSVRYVGEFTMSVWDVWESLQGQCEMCGRDYKVSVRCVVSRQNTAMWWRDTWWDTVLSAVPVRCVAEFTRSVWDVWQSLQGQCEMCSRVYMVSVRCVVEFTRSVW